MTKWVFKSIGLHLAIAVLYLGLTSYEFVASSYPNPMGVGIQQWLLIFAHIGLTGLVWLIIKHYAKNRKLIRKKMAIQLLIIVGIILLYLCLSGFVDSWLWSFRKEVIQ